MLATRGLVAESRRFELFRVHLLSFLLVWTDTVLLDVRNHTGNVNV